MKKDDIIRGILLLVVLIALGGFFLFAENGSQLSYGPVDFPGSSIQAMASGNGEVDVITTLIAPGYITIHQSLGAAPGPIVGVSGYIDAGTDISATIILSEVMEPGLTYIALLHVDNGDMRFAVLDDMPVTSGGQSVRSDFIAP